jgi:sulfite reductase alpha subunit-like flavoprotein
MYDEMFLHSIHPAQTLTMTATASTSSNSESEDDYSTDHVVVLYASETGNAEDTAERVGREFRRLGRRCMIMSMDMFDVVGGMSSG